MAESSKRARPRHVLVLDQGVNWAIGTGMPGVPSSARYHDHRLGGHGEYEAQDSMSLSSLRRPRLRRLSLPLPPGRAGHRLTPLLRICFCRPGDCQRHRLSDAVIQSRLTLVRLIHRSQPSQAFPSPSPSRPLLCFLQLQAAAVIPPPYLIFELQDSRFRPSPFHLFSRSNVPPNSTHASSGW